MQAQGGEVSEGNIPSKDPADEGSLSGVLRSTFRKLMQGVDGMLPAKVVNYDRTNNVATVQPLIALLTTDGAKVTRAQIARVPVLALGGGGFVLNFPLQQGDLGWIEASDRDISLYMQSLQEAQPNTLRFHSFEDARFIPDVMKLYDVSTAAADAMVIQSLDGTVRIELTPDTIRMKAPHLVGEFGDISFTGPTTFVNEVTFNAEATFTDDAVINGIRFSTHKHTGVTVGGGTSGGPTA